MGNDFRHATTGQVRTFEKTCDSCTGVLPSPQLIEQEEDEPVGRRQRLHDGGLHGRHRPPPWLPLGDPSSALRYGLVLGSWEGYPRPSHSLSSSVVEGARESCVGFSAELQTEGEENSR
ncbi:hypothetical protein GW17_00031132 [Ensete ventricosum]|nr:hypothetical protein GW17_00031132 [Ensete ventricosum]